MRKILTCIALMILGSGFAIWGWALIMDARASLSWPTATGTVTTSSVTSYYSQNKKMYSTDIQYTYKVNDRNYSSDQISLGDHSSSSSSGMKKLVNKYPVGKTITVYYDPTNKSKALLEPGPVIITYVPFVFGILAIISGLLALFRKKTSAIPPGSGHSGLTTGGKYSGG